ncbi:MAG: hypothetical protein ACOZAI_06625 [Pseudomonadota bacterium]
MIPARLKPAMSRVAGPLRQRFEALQPRERLLIITVGAALVWALAQMLYFNAAAVREKQLLSAASEARQQLALLEAREQILRIQLAEGSLVALESKRGELVRRQADLDAELKQQGRRLMDAERMRQVLHELLQGSNLSLIALRRLPPELVFGSLAEGVDPAAGGEGSDAKPARAAGGQGLALYRHPVQIELEGRYVDMVRYLERLEASPWRLMWQELDIETRDYPSARMRLTVYTLSLQEDWIGV